MFTVKPVRALPRLVSSAPLLLAGLVATGLGYATSLKESLRANVFVPLGVTNAVAQEVLIFALSFLVITGVVLVADAAYQRLRNPHVDRSISEGVRVTLWEDASGKRISAFQELRAQATSSIFVAGIGMTFLSSNLGYLTDLLDEGIDVRLLMLDPTVVESDPAEAFPEPATHVTADDFERWFARDMYVRDLRASYDRLVRFAAQRAGMDGRDAGVVELRTYRIPVGMNATLIDEKGTANHGRALCEWCLPFSERRLAAWVGDKDSPGSFGQIRDALEALWNEGVEVRPDAASAGAGT